MSEARPTFNNVSAGNGLLQECERICNLGAAGITGNATYLKDFTVRVNSAIDRLITLAFKYDNNWTLDDRRFGDDDATKGLPILSTNIKSGVGDYLFDTDILMVVQAFITDSSGNVYEIFPQDDKYEPNSYLFPTQTGRPTRFTLVGSSVILDYLPNYNYTLGLKLKVKRVAKHFASNDGGIALGVPQIFFDYIARKASYPFAMEKGLKHAPQLKKEIGSDNPRDPYYGGDELMVAEFFSQRSRPKRMRLTPRPDSGRDSNR